MINVVNNPERKDWLDLVRRPVLNNIKLQEIVTSIMSDVMNDGDAAVFKYNQLYDNYASQTLKVTDDEISTAIDFVPLKLKNAINTAKNNIETFHRFQKNEEPKIETTKGVFCWRKSIGIENVGLYIPGGTAPLFSTVLMLGIPAKIAGCNNISICTPADANGMINPVILYTANLIGINQIFKVGGAQAIAAMSYGTETIPKVDKIFGPGNQYVTKAKELVQQAGTSIDMPAGPSEVLIIADSSANAEYVAADLLSQAEHGKDSQVTLLTTCNNLVQSVMSCIKSQVITQPRKEIINTVLEKSHVIVFEEINDCFDFSNLYAPEHLIIASSDANGLIDFVVNAGSVFIGNYSSESAGDYASGTNHTLPTNSYAKAYSGVSVDSFVKKITFQELTAKGLLNLGNDIEIMAEAENLLAHKNAVSIRLKDLKNV